MITNVGKRIKVDAGNSITFYRDCDTPGLVTVSRGGHSPGEIALPGNLEEAERFIRAYRRVLAEDIGYRESKVE